MNICECIVGRLYIKMNKESYLWPQETYNSPSVRLSKRKTKFFVSLTCKTKQLVRETSDHYHRRRLLQHVSPNLHLSSSSSPTRSCTRRLNPQQQRTGLVALPPISTQWHRSHQTTPMARIEFQYHNLPNRLSRDPLPGTLFAGDRAHSRPGPSYRPHLHVPQDPLPTHHHP